MIVLDTTVLVYAVGGGHPLREPSRRLVDAIGQGHVMATTTVEVVQEFAHVYARRRSRQDAADRAADFATLLGPLVHPDEADLRRGLELFVAHASLGAFDAVLAAIVLNTQHLTAVVSADAAFGDIPGLRWLDPAVGDVVSAAAAHA